MSRFPKVIWNEGMFLSPHNFHGWEHYLKDEIDARFKALSLFDWGFIEIVTNNDDITGGSFSLISCKGIMPDGLPFEIPETDNTPETRAIGEHFSHSAKKLDVYLGIPVERKDAANCRPIGERSGRETRYLSDFISINDENTGENKREIPIGRKNFKILFAGELIDDYTCIKIAELNLNDAGLYEIREDYIPPCLYLSSSKRLMTIVRSLLDKLSGQSSTLSQQISQKSATQYEFHARDLTNFGLLSSINSFIPILSHFYQQAKVHPELLYRVLAQFAGALTTFSTEITARDIPSYSHTDLERTFGTLEQLINQLLGITGPAKCIQVPLRKMSESLVQGEIIEDLLERAQFFLAASANVPQAQLQNMLPQVVKIGPPDKIDYLIKMALRGITISHTGRPHPDIPIKVGYEYFKLDNTGDLWDQIRKLKAIAIYFPAGIPGLKLDLLAVKD